MEELTGIMKLIGEENVKKLQDGITDLLLQQVERDLEDKYQYDFILAFDDIYEEIKTQIEEEFKEKLVEKYREQMNKKLGKMFPN